jgi:hypothetical protein
MTQILCKFSYDSMTQSSYHYGAPDEHTICDYLYKCKQAAANYEVICWNTEIQQIY